MKSICLLGSSGRASLLFREAQLSAVSPGQPTTPVFHETEAESGAAFTYAVVKAALSTERVCFRTEEIDWMECTNVMLLKSEKPTSRAVRERVESYRPRKKRSIEFVRGSPGDTDLLVWIVKRDHSTGKAHSTPPHFDHAELIISTDVLPLADGVCGEDAKKRALDPWVEQAPNLNRLRASKADRILVTCADAFRHAGYRTREEGSLSATVEDVGKTILNATDAEREKPAEKFFSLFSRIFVRLRGDGLLELRQIPLANGTGAQWTMCLHHAIDANNEEWSAYTGSLYGLTSVLTASIVIWVSKGRSDNDDKFVPAMRRVWNLVKRGCRLPKVDEPFEQWIAAAWEAVDNPQLKEGEFAPRFETVAVDPDQIRQLNRWSILEACLSNGLEKGASLDPRVLGYARHIARKGYEEKSLPEPIKAIKTIKHFKLGKLATADRSEVESLSGLQRLMTTYPRQLAANPGKKEQPLCVAVFGAPGSGKSFGVEEIARTASQLSENPGKSLQLAEEPLSYNVSQFTQLGDLSAALHQVREERLKGKIPVVIFDEFDSSFEGQAFGWLKYFLMPMQDGKFRDRETVYLTGGCIMVFAGGINHQYAEFAGRQRDREFASAKGPDFLSRLRAVHDVPSLNRDDSPVPRWQIRRAGLLYTFLEKRKATILDDRLLNALLEIERFHHGARSLESIIQMSAQNAQGEIDITSLPRRHQLDLHVDSKRLWELIRRPVPGLAGDPVRPARAN